MILFLMLLIVVKKSLRKWAIHRAILARKSLMLLISHRIESKARIFGILRILIVVLPHRVSSSNTLTLTRYLLQSLKTPFQ